MKERASSASQKMERILTGLAGGAGLGSLTGAIAEGVRRAYFLEAEAFPYIGLAIGGLLGFRWISNMTREDQKQRNA